MLIGFADWCLKHPYRTAGVVVALSLLPVGAFIAMALMALAVLRYGAQQSAWVVVSALLMSLVAWWLNGVALPTLFFVQTLVMAEVLRRRTRWEDTLLIGALVVAGASLLDSTLWIPEGFALPADRASDASLLSGFIGADASDEQARTLLGRMLCLATYLPCVLSVMLGRHWQAALFNAKGFQREFHAFRLTPWVAMLLLVITLACIGSGIIAYAFLPVTILVIAAAALMHGLVGQQSLSRMWLFGFYAALSIQPLGIIIVSLLVIIDAFMNLRHRLARSQH